MGRSGSRSLHFTEGRCSSPRALLVPECCCSSDVELLTDFEPLRHSLSPEDWARGGSMGLKVEASDAGLAEFVAAASERVAAEST